MPECVDSPEEDRDFFSSSQPNTTNCVTIVGQYCGINLALHVSSELEQTALLSLSAFPVNQTKNLTLFRVHSSLLCSALWWGNPVYQSAATPPLSNLPLKNCSFQTTIGFTKVFYSFCDIKLKIFSWSWTKPLLVKGSLLWAKPELTNKIIAQNQTKPARRGRGSHRDTGPFAERLPQRPGLSYRGLAFHK